MKARNHHFLPALKPGERRDPSSFEIELAMSGDVSDREWVQTFLIEKIKCDAQHGLSYEQMVENMARYFNMAVEASWPELATKLLRTIEGSAGQSRGVRP